MVLIVSAIGLGGTFDSLLQPSNPPSASESDGQLKEIENLNLKLGTIRPDNDPTTI